MGSGSSKSQRRAIWICSRHPLEPTVGSIPDKTTKATCKQKKKDNDMDVSVGRNVTDLGTKTSTLRPGDPDLQLLDDILAESEDCWSWPQSTSVRPKMTGSFHTEPNPGSLSQVMLNENGEPLHINKPVPPQYGGLQYRPQTVRDSFVTDPEPRSALDMENNNLLKSSSTCVASHPTLYDDVEEALMDSIEKEYTHVPPISSIPSENPYGGLQMDK